MCGRFTLRAPAASWCQMFLPDLSPGELPAFPQQPRYNIAPTQQVAMVVQKAPGRHRQLMFARWGLVPSWADDLSIGARMINARSETVDRKPSFKRAFGSRRCLIPADGYYEWLKTTSAKQPYLIESAGGDANGGVMAMAGLWEVNKKLADEDIVSCTVLTTSANETTQAIHNRMPVFLSIDAFQQWLDPSFRDVGALKKLLKPAANDQLKTTPVSRHVGNVRNDDAACIEPVSTNADGVLFDT